MNPPNLFSHESVIEVDLEQVRSDELICPVALLARLVIQMAFCIREQIRQATGTFFA